MSAHHISQAHTPPTLPRSPLRVYITLQTLAVWTWVYLQFQISLYTGMPCFWFGIGFNLEISAFSNRFLHRICILSISQLRYERQVRIGDSLILMYVTCNTISDAVHADYTVGCDEVILTQSLLFFSCMLLRHDSLVNKLQVGGHY